MSNFVNQRTLMRKVTAPTYIGYVDTVLDALLLFEACNLGILERAKQRPSPADRARFICSGSVFVWDEGQTGIRRWTDGRRWSSSRPRGNFIIYRELSNGPCRDSTEDASGGNSGSSGEEDYSALDEATMKRELLAGYATVKNASNVISAIRNPMLVKPPLGGSHPPTADAPLGSALTSSGCLLPIKPGGLTKRALSLTTRDGRRLHLISYYLPEDVVAGKLRTPSLDPALSNVRIRANVYSQSMRELGHFSENPPTLQDSASSSPPLSSNSSDMVKSHDKHRILPENELSHNKSLEYHTEIVRGNQFTNNNNINNYNRPSMFIHTDDRYTDHYPINATKRVSPIDDNNATTSLPSVSSLLQHSAGLASNYCGAPLPTSSSSMHGLQPTPPPNASAASYANSPISPSYEHTSIHLAISQNRHRATSTASTSSYTPVEQHRTPPVSSDYVASPRQLTTPPHLANSDANYKFTVKSEYPEKSATFPDHLDSLKCHVYPQTHPYSQGYREYPTSANDLSAYCHSSTNHETHGTRKRAYSTNYSGFSSNDHGSHPHHLHHHAHPHQHHQQQRIAVELGMPEHASPVVNQSLSVSVNFSTDRPSPYFTVTAGNPSPRSYSSSSLPLSHPSVDHSTSTSSLPSKYTPPATDPYHFPSIPAASPTDPRHYASSMMSSSSNTSSIPIPFNGPSASSIMASPMTYTKSSSPPKHRYHPYEKSGASQTTTSR